MQYALTVFLSFPVDNRFGCRKRSIAYARKVLFRPKTTKHRRDGQVATCPCMPKAAPTNNLSLSILYLYWHLLSPQFKQVIQPSIMTMALVLHFWQSMAFSGNA